MYQIAKSVAELTAQVAPNHPCLLFALAQCGSCRSILYADSTRRQRVDLAMLGATLRLHQRNEQRHGAGQSRHFCFDRRDQTAPSTG